MNYGSGEVRVIRFEEKENYKEIELWHGNVKIGEAEVDLANNMLARIVIYEPYQDKGLGTEAVQQLTETYNLNNLWVRADNEKAIHVYQKCGYISQEPTMYKMVKGVIP